MGRLLYGQFRLSSRSRRNQVDKDHCNSTICRIWGGSNCVRYQFHRTFSDPGQSRPIFWGLAHVQIGWINLAFVILVIFLGGYILQYIWVEDRRGTFDEPLSHATMTDALAESPSKD